jgi:predicted DNA-binding transcriptional regulator AlpA
MATETRKPPKLDEGLAARLINLLENQPAELPKLDRLVSVKHMSDLTGWHRTTLLRAEALGHIPRRRKLPNGQTAYLATEVTSWLKGLALAPLPSTRKRESCGRIYS